MKFSDIAKGTRALSEPTTVEIAPGVNATFRFRPLAPFEASAVLTAARAEAKTAGVDSPEAGEPIYEAARTIHTIAFGLVDADSGSDDPKPYFDGGVEQIRMSRLLTNDIIAFLFELWELWADETSLQKAMFNEVDFNRTMEEAAVGNARPFFEKRPGTRWNYFRTMAARHVSLLKARWSSGSGSPASETPPSPAPESPKPDSPSTHQRSPR